jgi:MarR family transcriptional regulator, 2-MHQ and catechol-resistance regulon repressor
MSDCCSDALDQQFKERFPKLDHSSVKMVAALANAHHILFSVMERAFSKSGITPQSMEVLRILYLRKEQGYLLGEIGEQLMVSPANVTGLVEGLVKKGLVDRKEQPGDRRKRLTELTPLGIEFIEKLIPVIAGFFGEVFTSLSSEDKQQLYDRLNQLSKLLRPYWDKRLAPQILMPEALQRALPSMKKRM